MTVEHSARLAASPPDTHHPAAAQTAAGDADFQRLADAMPTLAWVAHADGWIHWYNRRWYEYTGTTPGEMEGWGWESVHDPAQLPAVKERWLAAIAGGHPFEMTFPLRGADGLFRPFLTRVVPVRDADGRIARWVGTNTDVSPERAARAAIERERALLQAVIDALPVGVFVTDPAGGELLQNQALRDLWRGGRPIADAAAYEQYVGWDAATGERLRAEDWPLARALRTGQRQAPRELRFQRFDGTVGTMIIMAFALHDGDGRVERAVAVAEDVTEQREAQALLARRERELARIADNAPAVIARFDRDRRHTFVNRAIEAATGLSPAQYLGRTNRELGMPPELCDLWDGAVDRAFAGERQLLEFHFDAPDGRHHFQWLVVPEVDETGAVSSVLGVAHDVTALRRSEDTLREADARKNEFLAMLAHELRNPLAPIANAVRLLEREAALSSAGERAVGMIGRQVQQMRRLVDDLLEVNRITRGTIELKAEPVLLGSLLLSIVEAALPSAEAKRLALRTSLPREAVKLVADPVRLSQVIENLVSNAVKYTPEGGTIDVELLARSDAVELRVSDDGIGIPRDKLDSVFELFVQAEPGVGAHQGGLGIGLAMVKRLVELHGGRVWAESAGRGKGATFVVRLPKDGAPG